MNNIKNKLITKKNIENIINKYIVINKDTDKPVIINNIKQFRQAFIHKSFCDIDIDNSDTDNYSSINIKHEDLFNYERLEFVGDRVIDLIIAEYLFNKYPDKDQGFLTRLKSKLVDKTRLPILAEKLGFRTFVLISSHLERISGRNNVKFLEDIFESFMAVLYRDQGYQIDICRRFLLGVYSEFIDIEHLIKQVRTIVQDKTGISLTPEVCIIGRDK